MYRRKDKNNRSSLWIAKRWTSVGSEVLFLFLFAHAGVAQGFDEVCYELHPRPSWCPGGLSPSPNPPPPSGGSAAIPGGNGKPQPSMQRLGSPELMSGTIEECRGEWFRTNPECDPQTLARSREAEQCEQLNSESCLTANAKLEACLRDGTSWIRSCVAQGSRRGSDDQFYGASGGPYQHYRREQEIHEALEASRNNLDRKHEQTLDALGNAENILMDNAPYQGTGGGIGSSGQNLASVDRDRRNLEDFGDEESESEIHHNQDGNSNMPDADGIQHSTPAKADEEQSQQKNHQNCSAANKEQRIQELEVQRERLIAAHKVSANKRLIFQEEKKFQQQIADEGTQDAKRGMVANGARVVSAAADEIIDRLAQWTQASGGDIVKRGYTASKEYFSALAVLANSQPQDTNSTASQMTLAGKALVTAANITWLSTGSDKATAFIEVVSNTTKAVGNLNEGKILDASLSAAGAGEKAGEVVAVEGNINPISQELGIASTIANAKEVYEGINGIREGLEDQEAIIARNEHFQQHADEMIDEATRKFREDDRKLEQIYKELECLRALP